MRNLKRALSLALASVMLMGMMVVGTGAAFTDADSIKNTEAVDVLNAIEVLKGYDDGSFQGEKIVTRAEMAVILVRIYTGDVNYDVSGFEGIPSFTDTADHWAEGYINYAYTEGLIAGYDDGSFGPEKTVTTAEAYIMLARAIGYFANGEGTGATWALDAVKYAGIADIDVAGLKATAGLTRDDVAAVTFKTIVANPVKFITSDDDEDTYLTYQDAGSAELATALGLDSTSGTTVDTMGRPITEWTLKGETDVVATSTVAANATYTAPVSYTDIADGMNKGVNTDTLILNGDETCTVAEVFGAGYTATSETLDGIVVEVFDGYAADGTVNSAFTIYVAYTYETSEVKSVEYDEDDDQTTITLDSGAILVVDGEDDTYAEDDVVTYTANGTDIDTIEMANIVTGTVDGYKGTTVTVDGVAYTVLGYVGDTGDIDAEATMVIDPNGYVIDFDADGEDAETAYLYTLSESSGSELDGYRVKVIFANGTTEVIYVDTIEDDGDTTDDDVDSTNIVAKDTIYAYSEEDGVYSLKSKDVTADEVTAADGSSPSADNFKFDTDKIMDDATVFVDVDAGVIYTGFENIPVFVDADDDEKGVASEYVYSDTLVEVVFLLNAAIEGETDDEVVYAYVEDADSSVSKDANGDAVYTYTVFVNGKETTIVADATSIATGWVTFSEFDENGTANGYAVGVTFDVADATIAYTGDNSFWIGTTKYTTDSDTVYVIVEDGEITTTVASKVTTSLTDVDFVCDDDNLVSLFVINK